MIEAKEKFLERMAGTINATAQTDTPSQMKERWNGFDEVDVKKAQAIAARARREAMRSKIS